MLVAVGTWAHTNLHGGASLENLDDSIDWAVDGTDLDKLEGDDYNQMKKAVMTRTIEYMLNWLEANPTQEIDFDIVK